MSISVIEDLSNEIFHELFQYLDETETYRVFNHLNSRFQELVTSSLDDDDDDDDFDCISLPIVDQTELSSIKKCIIENSCSPEELYDLISRFPQLKHLKLADLSECSNSNNKITFQDDYSNLKYLSIEMCSITCDELQICLSYIGSNLKSLKLEFITDYFDYLDDYEWEDFISNYLPNLKTFYLNYNQTIDPESDFLPRPTPPNGFTSEFWNKKDWRLEIEMNFEDVNYTIDSYKKRWYDDEDAPSNEFDKSTRLILSSIPRELSRLSGWTIGDMFDTIPIYHLEISMDNISSDRILQLMSQLPTLISLKIKSMTLSESMNSYLLKNKINLLAKKNKIIKIYLEKVNELDEIDFFIQLCPHLKCLKIDSMNNDASAEEFIKNKYSNIYSYSK